MTVRLADPTPEAYRFPLLIRHLLTSALDTRTAAEIVGTDGRRHGYPEFARRVARLARILADRGVRAGDTVAVMDWDSHRYLEAYFAIPMMGAVLQTVNVRLSPEQVAYTVSQTCPSAILVHADFETLLAEIRASLPHDLTIIGLQDDRPHAQIADYETLLAAADTPFIFTDFDEDALATTFHTTGTTGLPKAVAFSHRQLVLHTLSVMGAFAAQPNDQAFRRDDVYMPITPMFHVHAWGLPYVATLLGVKQVYPGRYVAERLVALREAEGVTFSHGVPTIVQMLVEAIGDRVRTTPWKMVVGGSAFPTSLRRAAAGCGIVAFAGYGMSETGPVLTLARAANDGDRDRLSHAGQAIPLVQIALDDGEVVARAPWLTQGYVDDVDASADLWRGGWLHTQDVATIEDDGDLVIRDRLKDVIKTGGEWVSSAQMEDLTMRHPRVIAASYIGIADERWGERPVAFLVGRGTTPDLSSIREHLAVFVERGTISRYALPDRIIPIAELPRTSVGKIDKKALRMLAASV